MGGTNALHNFQVLCPMCHAEKTQLEMIARGEQNQAKQTQVSRFFDPLSVDFVGAESFAEFLENFRFGTPSFLT